MIIKPKSRVDGASPALDTCRCRLKTADRNIAKTIGSFESPCGKFAGFFGAVFGQRSSCVKKKFKLSLAWPTAWGLIPCL